jgi:nucleotide-binding universal stress UspA family protein
MRRPRPQGVQEGAGATFALCTAMSAFNHVLVATDFGKPAERAEELGIAFADKFAAKLTVLFVFSVPNAAYATGSYFQIDQLERQARKALDGKMAKLKERFPQVAGVMRAGAPWEEILAASKEMGVDLIVMGTHGRRGLPRALLGSVAERVVRMAAVPVLTVSASEPERAAAVPAGQSR